MKSEELLESISVKLSAILFVLLSPDVGEKTTAQKVGLLARLGLPNRDIAHVLGTTKGTVEVLKSRESKKRR